MDSATRYTPRIVLIITFIALIVALVLSEAVVRYVCRFPDTGIIKFCHVYPNDLFTSGQAFEKIYVPHARYCSVEDGYSIYKRNNLGFLGKDISVSGKKNIYLVGNSFIEAKATSPQKMVSSVFMDLVQKHCSDELQVINLGIGGQIPSLGLYRLSFWEKKLKPEYVMLVLEQKMLQNTDEYSDKAYKEDSNFGTPVKSLSLNIVGTICLYSSFANVIRNSFSYKRVAPQVPANTHNIRRKDYDVFDADIYAKNLSAILEYRKRYGDRFILFSLLNHEWNNQLQADCSNYNIRFSCNSEIRSIAKYHIGEGHFNDLGNEVFGKELYRFFSVIWNNDTLKEKNVEIKG